MLVFLSDIHWTDGTSGDTIHSGAFRGFVQDLRRMAKDANAKDLEVVLLGDIFDLIRSEQWIKAKVRPWETNLHLCNHRFYESCKSVLGLVS